MMRLPIAESGRERAGYTRNGTTTSRKLARRQSRSAADEAGNRLSCVRENRASAPMVQDDVLVVNGYGGRLQFAKRCHDALGAQVTRRIVFSAYDQDSEVTALRLG